MTLVKIGENTNAPVLELCGLSSEIKPIGFYGSDPLITGSTFWEIDTGTIFAYDAESQTWIEQ